MRCRVSCNSCESTARVTPRSLLHSPQRYLPSSPRANVQPGCPSAQRTTGGCVFVLPRTWSPERNERATTSIPTAQQGLRRRLAAGPSIGAQYTHLFDGCNADWSHDSTGTVGRIAAVKEMSVLTAAMRIGPMTQLGP